MSQEQISTSLWLAWTSGPFYKSLSLRLGAIPHSNSGKRTLAYTATKLFNDLSSDLKEFSISSSPLILKFLPSLLSLNYEVCFSHAYHRPNTWSRDLLCSTCRYSIHCHCFSYSPTTTTITSFDLYLHIYVYMFIYSTYFACLRRFIYYSLRVYSLVYFTYCLFCVYIYIYIYIYIYLYKFICFLSSKFIYLFIGFLRAVG